MMPEHSVWHDKSANHEVQLETALLPSNNHLVITQSSLSTSDKQVSWYTVLDIIGVLSHRTFGDYKKYTANV